MKCTSRSCRSICENDNCIMTTHGQGSAAGTFANCRGRGCYIDVHSMMGQVICEKGSCRVRFSKNTDGSLTCPAGNCTFICAKGKSCNLNGACPNCTGPLYVDDPFSGTSNAVIHINDIILFAICAVSSILFTQLA